MLNSIRHYRQKLGLTQSDLANRVGTSKNTISNLETGIFSPSLKIAYKISLALSVSVYDLFPLSNIQNSFPVNFENEGQVSLF